LRVGARQGGHFCRRQGLELPRLLLLWLLLLLLRSLLRSRRLGGGSSSDGGRDVVLVPWRWRSGAVLG